MNLNKSEESRKTDSDENGRKRRGSICSIGEAHSHNGYKTRPDISRPEMRLDNDYPNQSLLKSEKSTIYYYNQAYVPPRRPWWVETPFLQ